MTLCQVCDTHPSSFVATFKDNVRFALCLDCTNDLCCLVDSFVMNVAITAASQREDDIGYTDPQELLFSYADEE